MDLRDRDTATSPIVGSPPSTLHRAVLGMFVAVPLTALVVGVPVAFTRGWVHWWDVVMLVVLYAVGVHGVTIGYHRLFTHASFKAGPVLRTVLAVAGSVAVEGRVLDWVADHRKHHQFSDRDGDPHSPWAFGDGTGGLLRGLWHAHLGWMFSYEGTDVHRYAPDLVADRALDRVSRWWPGIATVSFVVPALIGGVLDGWSGLLIAFFWTTLVRVALVHHMTWSINSVCHVWGSRPFASRDRAANVAWLSVISGGESWHNYHHVDPTSARHGVLRGQLDSSARIIRLFELLGWVWDVRWPSASRVSRRRAGAISARHG